MDIYKEENNELMDYIHHCKYINKYKLVNRFNYSDEEAYEIIDQLLEYGEVEPMHNFNFRVIIRIFDKEE